MKKDIDIVYKIGYILLYDWLSTSISPPSSDCTMIKAGVKSAFFMAALTLSLQMKSKEKTLFLHALSDHGIVSKAAETAKISRSVVYRERTTDHEFKEAWDHAKEIATDRLANIAHQRAIDGIEEIRYFKGEPIGTVRRYSDQLLMFLLRAYRPSVFGANQQKNFESKDNNNDQARQSLVTKMAALDGQDDG